MVSLRYHRVGGPYTNATYTLPADYVGRLQFMAEEMGVTSSQVLETLLWELEQGDDDQGALIVVNASDKWLDAFAALMDGTE